MKVLAEDLLVVLCLLLKSNMDLILAVLTIGAMFATVGIWTASLEESLRKSRKEK